MLKSLHIKNVAIISSLTIDFSDKLNVLSGETGAGKSIILDALTFVIGSKADKSLIRFNTSEMAVEAVFDISGNREAHSTLKEIDIDAEDEIIIYRSLNLQGGGQTKINGKNVVASMLKNVSSCLIDICGQSEHISLLKTSNNLKFLDGYGGNEISDVRQKVAHNYLKYKEIIKEILSYGGNEAERQKNTDLYDYQIKEIENASLKEGEDEELSAKRAQLLNIGKIADSLNSAAGLLSGGEVSLISKIKDLTGYVVSAHKYLPELDKTVEKLNELKYELDDINNTIESNLSSLDYNERAADEIENRYDLIKNLKRKYGNSYEEINKYLEKIKIDFEKFKNAETEILKLTKEKDAVLQILNVDSGLLTEKRKICAKELENKIESELKHLNMQNSRFVIEFKNSNIDFESRLSADGVDDIEFMFSANLGEPLKPLNRIISGGEMSRFMLAIKSISAGAEDIGTLIFDEIDTGISGQTSSVVAQKMAKISRFRQVILITHTPIIAAMADKNFLIEKKSENDTTVSNVLPLTDNAKIREIARLIGTGKSLQYANLHAEEMLKWAQDYKELLSQNVEKILEFNLGSKD